MIRLFDRNETNFNHNQNVLSPISCFVDEEANGMFELECEVDRSVSIGNGDIIKAPTPRGEQLFRVYHTNRTLKGKKAYGKHVFYDLEDNFIVRLDLNNITGVTAFNGILHGTEYEHGYTVSSDILTLGSAKFVRVNPVQAILGDGGLIDIWGGNIVRDGYHINYKSNGIDRGYEVRMGKNLVGVEDNSDESNVKTRIYPYVELGNDVTVTLPEKYVDSPLLLNYGKPKIVSQKVELTEEQKGLPVDQLYTIMREYCQKLYSISNIDKPVINYKINFVELSKTEQYKGIAILEQLDLYDIVTCNISQLDINVKAKVIKYKYNCLKMRYDTIELGDFSAASSYQTNNIIKQISERFKATASAIDHATNVITGNRGGHLIIRTYPNGKPYELLIMDTEDINTAKNVFRLNNNGLGFSRNGYNGPYETAMTLDGHIVADFIDTGTLTAILLKSANYAADAQGNITQGSRFNLADGLLETMNGIFKGKIFGSEITGSSFETIGEASTAKLKDGLLEIDGINDNKALLSSMYLRFIKGSERMIALEYLNGSVKCKELNTDSAIINKLNAGIPITDVNKYQYQFPPNSHGHTSYEITPMLTDARNINFYGSVNAASVEYVQDNFERKSSSDFRLKKNIQSLSNLPIELYMELKPMIFDYKCDLFHTKTVFGLIAQEVMSAFERYGLNALDYDLVEEVEPKPYTDEGLYVNGKLYRINYSNFHAWTMEVVHKQWTLINNLVLKVNSLIKVNSLKEA